eukprot:g4920.t1
MLACVFAMVFLVGSVGGCDEGGKQGQTDDGHTVCCPSTCDSCDDAGCELPAEGTCCPSFIAINSEDCDTGSGVLPPCVLSEPQTPVPAPTPDVVEKDDDNNGDDDDQTTADDDDRTTGDNNDQSTGDDDGSNGDDSQDGGNTTPAPAQNNGILPAGESASKDDDSAGIIALSVLFSALLLGNAICFGCFMAKRRKRPPTPAPPVRMRDPNADAELGRLTSELGQLQGDLAGEQNRRVRAEALLQRAKGGGIRPGDFPSVRDVDRHVEKMADYALGWTEKARAIGRSHPALPATTKSVLENAFVVCRDEVKRCLDRRLQSLSEFLGDNEPVALSGGDSMNLDTQYVLYECLRRNFRTIVSVAPDHMEKLAGMVEQRCGGGGVVDGNLASDIIFGDAWASFDNLMKGYLMVFVEMALQRPPMDFEDDLGKIRDFDSLAHRDWAPNSQSRTGQQCCIVFPTVRPREGRTGSNTKAGVVRLPA